jgi:hypothetical protein
MPPVRHLGRGAPLDRNVGGCIAHSRRDPVRRARSASAGTPERVTPAEAFAHVTLAVALNGSPSSPSSRSRMNSTAGVSSFITTTLLHGPFVCGVMPCHPCLGIKRASRSVCGISWLGSSADPLAACPGRWDRPLPIRRKQCATKRCDDHTVGPGRCGDGALLEPFCALATSRTARGRDRARWRPLNKCRAVRASPLQPYA